MYPTTNMRPLGNSGLQVPVIGLGTWAIGGFLWGGTDEKESEDAIVASIQNAVTLIDTAPIYGFGLAEEIVGKTLKGNNLRDKVLLATKCGLEWSEDRRLIKRNSTPERIRLEVDEILKRLQTDVIDLYQIHWPDTHTPFAESLQTLEEIKQSGKIRAYGVSNFSAAQLDECLQTRSITSNQPPYNIFEREIEKEILPFCREHNIGILAYGALCRGLLSGRITKNTEFPHGDLRCFDPKFKPDKKPQYLKAVDQLKKMAEEKNCTVGQLAIAWVFQQPGVTCALVGARNAKQAELNAGALQVKLNQEDFDQVDQILEKEIKTPTGPEFFAPPS